MYRRGLIVCLALFLLFAPTIAQSQKSKPGPPAPPTPQKDERPFSSQPFDLSQETLSAQYAGHSCQTIAEVIKAAKPEKDEFETTESYKGRIERLKSHTLFGTVTLTGTLSFVADTTFRNPTNPIFQKYDADSQTLHAEISIWSTPYLREPPRRLRGVVLETKDIKRSSYTASNASGKTVTVEKSEYRVCGLLFLNKPVDFSPSSITATFQVPPQEARSLKGDLRILYIGRLTLPYHSRYIESLEPTIKSPLEVTWYGDGLVMELNQVWVFNSSSGKVYVKLDQ